MCCLFGKGAPKTRLSFPLTIKGLPTAGPRNASTCPVNGLVQSEDEAETYQVDYRRGLKKGEQTLHLHQRNTWLYTQDQQHPNPPKTQSRHVTLPTGYLLARGECPFIVKRPSRCHLNHVCDPAIRQPDHMGPRCGVCKCPTLHDLCHIFYQKLFKLSLIRGKQSDESRLWDVLQDNCSGSLKCQYNKRPKDCPRLKETKETVQPYAMCDELDSRSYMGHFGDH